jgi:hypothetical protein
MTSPLSWALSDWELLLTPDSKVNIGYKKKLGTKIQLTCASWSVLPSQSEESCQSL